MSACAAAPPTAASGTDEDEWARVLVDTLLGRGLNKDTISVIRHYDGLLRLDAFEDFVCSGVQLQRAIKSHELPLIGYCYSAEKAWDEEHEVEDESEDDEDEVEDGVEDDEDDEDDEDEVMEEGADVAADVATDEPPAPTDQATPRVARVTAVLVKDKHKRVILKDLQQHLSMFNRKSVVHGRWNDNHPVWSTVLHVHQHGQLRLSNKLSELRRDGPADAVLCQVATPSTFGDLCDMQTKMDQTVRSSKDIPYAPNTPRQAGSGFWFKDAALTDLLADEWAESMLPSNVRVVPYKLNVYATGDFFTEHRDTPEVDLVGSIVVELRLPMRGGELQFNSKKITFYRADANYYMFHPDQLHSVSKVQSASQYRISISFKVYGIGSGNGVRPEPKPKSREAQLITSRSLVLSAVQRLCHHVWHDPSDKTKRFGLILKYMYGTSDCQPKGSDQVLFDCLTLCGVGKQIHVQQLPITLRYQQSLPVGEMEDRPVTEVRSMSKAALQWYHQREREHERQCIVDGPAAGCVPLGVAATKVDDPPETSWSLRTPFYGDHRAGMQWYRDLDQGAESTGNESRDGHEDCLYLSRALVVEVRGEVQQLS